MPCYFITNVEKNWAEALILQPTGQGCWMYTLVDGRVGYCWIQGAGIWFAELAADYAAGGTPVLVNNSGSYDSVACTSDGHVIRVIGRLTSSQELYEWYTLDHWTTKVGPTLLT